MASAKTVKVYSNSDSVSHQPSNGNIYWLWEKNPYEDECYLELDRKEFENEMRKSFGLRRMFEYGILSIKESTFLEKFNLKDINEYVLSNSDLEKFIEDSSTEDFEDYLKYAPKTMLDNIEIICTRKELTDRRKLKLFREYTGKDLEEFYEDKENEGSEPKPETKKGRQPRKKVTN